MQFDLLEVKTREDIEQLATMGVEIWNECYASIISQAQIDYMLHTFQSVRAITDQMQNDRYTYYFMTASGKRIGYLAIKEEDGKLFLSKFYILKEHRGKGFAGRAIDTLVHMCKARTLNAIWLTVNRHNETAIAVYKKKGFHIVRTQIADIGNGFVMDDYVMELQIETIV